MDINQTLKLKEIDQLASAILQFSKNTLITKRICASLLVAIVALILQVTDDKLDFAIYVACMATLLIFWIIDSSSYYYQRLLRIRMSKIVNELKGNLTFLGYGMPLKRDEKITWFESLFNASQLFYLLTLFVTVIIAVCDLVDYF